MVEPVDEVSLVSMNFVTSRYFNSSSIFSLGIIAFYLNMAMLIGKANVKVQTTNESSMMLLAAAFLGIILILVSAKLRNAGTNSTGIGKTTLESAVSKMAF